MLAEFSDGFVLLFGTFLGAIVSSFAGFAFSPVAGIVMVDGNCRSPRVSCCTVWFGRTPSTQVEGAWGCMTLKYSYR